MTGMTTSIAVAAAGFAAFCLTALARQIAPRVGLLCYPDGNRKLHQRPTPLGGGLAIFMAAAAILGALLVVPNPWYFDLWAVRRQLLGLFLAGTTIVLLGLYDDRFGMRGRQKMAGQIVAAAILMSSGYLVQRVELFGVNVELGLLSIPFTCFWLVGSMNAVNLLDGIDGLATTIGIIVIGTLAVISVATGNVAVIIIALIVAGSLLGFMCFNFPPASVFLGDAGSMLIGLLIAALAIQGSMKGAGTVLLGASLAVCTIPVVDCSAAIVRRKLTGRSIFSTDRGHLHHCLLNRLGSNRKVLAFMSICCGVTSVAALLSVHFRSDLVAVLVSIGIGVVFVASGLFGRAEAQLLLQLARRLAGSLLRRKTGYTQKLIQLQGSHEWTTLWTAITTEADRLSVRKISLNLNLPMVHEGCAAVWEKEGPGDPEEYWYLDVPLTIAAQTVGRLSILGDRNGGSFSQDVEPILHLIGPLEIRLRAIVDEHLVEQRLVA